MHMRSTNMFSLDSSNDARHDISTIEKCFFLRTAKKEQQKNAIKISSNSFFYVIRKEDKEDVLTFDLSKHNRKEGSLKGWRGGSLE